MKYLTAEEVILIHERILGNFGGIGGLRDWKLFDSVVQRPKVTFKVERTLSEFIYQGGNARAFSMPLTNDLCFDRTLPRF